MGTPVDLRPVRFFVSIIYQENGQMPEIENNLISLLEKFYQEQTLRLSCTQAITKERWGPGFYDISFFLSL